MAKKKRPPSFGTDKSLEDQFLASLEEWFPEPARSDTPFFRLKVEREVKPDWLGKRAFRFDFRLSYESGDCLVECNGGAGARSGHATLMGRTRDHQKAALAAFAGQTLFSFTSPQVKSGEAAETVAAWLRGHDVPACLTEPPRVSRAARRAKKLASGPPKATKAARKAKKASAKRPRAKKARLKRAA